MAEENRGTYEGSCFCGAVRYEVKGPIGPMSNCFCTDCRRSHAAPFSTFIDALKANFRFVKGEDQLNTYLAESGAKRSFCRNCGSILICFNDANAKIMEITAATLVTPTDLKPEFHIFVRSKVPWYEIRDDHPQHQTMP